MSFKMSQTDKDIRVHNCPANLCLFYVLSAFYRHRNIIGTLKTVPR